MCSSIFNLHKVHTDQLTKITCRAEGQIELNLSICHKMTKCEMNTTLRTCIKSIQTDIPIGTQVGFEPRSPTVDKVSNV